MDSSDASVSQIHPEPTDDDLRQRIRRIFNETLIEYGLMLNYYPNELLADEMNYYSPYQDRMFVPHPNINIESHNETPPHLRSFTPLSP